MNVTIEFSNNCNSTWTPPLEDCKRWINAALNDIAMDCDFSVCLRFVEPEEAGELNKNYRGKDKATNVLSFPANFPDKLSETLQYRPLGDIVICPQVVECEAKEQGKQLEAHWAHMLIHGALHLSGFDHSNESETELMETHEVNTLENLGFPNPYLIG
ncbi:MAG: rRNA maturation RNase YbeY [Pseudomonadales bacterium]|nr:rRNA maturation RNase YbeY [Pseudomonadales bacterium]